MEENSKNSILYLNPEGKISSLKIDQFMIIQIQKGVAYSIFAPHPCLLFDYLKMLLAPFFVISTAFESTKKLEASNPCE